MTADGRRSVLRRAVPALLAVVLAFLGATTVHIGAPDRTGQLTSSAGHTVSAAHAVDHAAVAAAPADEPPATIEPCVPAGVVVPDAGVTPHGRRVAAGTPCRAPPAA